MLFKAKNKVLYKDWIWDWLFYKKDYIKESTYANYSILTSMITLMKNIFSMPFKI